MVVRVLIVLLTATFTLPSFAKTVEFDEPDLAGLSGFRVMWDESIPLAADGAVEFTDTEVKDKHPTAVWAAEKRGDEPGAIAFDALQRKVLVRFPGSAEAIAAEIQQGQQIEKVELVLPYRDHELWPPHGRDMWDPESGGYTARRNWGVAELYRDNPPNWHAIAWAVRKPWSMQNPELGPTYNAFIGSAGYWDRFGAQDERADRFPTRFGPTEVSTYEPDGVMDVTAVVNDPAFGETLGERLRVLSDQGFVIRKWELYDHRYFNGVYEWATATGGRGILLNTPSLRVTFRAAPSRSISLPPAADIEQLAKTLRGTAEGGEPTAKLLSPEELDAFNQQVMDQPEHLSDRSYAAAMDLFERSRKANELDLDEPYFFDYLLSKHVVTRLYGTSKRTDRGVVFEPAAPYERYKAWVDQVIANQPRGWSGFSAARDVLQWFRFGDALPGPARESITLDWQGWLMPDRPTASSPQKRMDHLDTSGALVHPMADQLASTTGGGTEHYVVDTYWKQTGDWRGNKSFYRSGFMYTISTQNFNTTSSMGALLGGAIIDAPLAIKDGRIGIESYPLGMWTWRAGSSQEHLDHYYYSVTMSGNKAVWDFGPTPYDRHLGRIMMAYNIEELAGAYHPGLRRTLAPATRTAVKHFLAEADGIYHVLHTLDDDGALFDPDKLQNLPEGMELYGSEVPPVVIANQTLTGDWADDWVRHTVGGKPLPFYARHRGGGGTRTAYLGKNYGLASIDVRHPHTQIVGHWKRDAQKADQVQDVGTMFLRFGVNDTKWSDDGSGYIRARGSTPAFQHENKLLVVSSPPGFWHGETGVGSPGQGRAEQINTLQTSIALFNYESQPTWAIYVDGQPVTTLPHSVRQGQVITVHDGVSYLGIVPLPATDLQRDAEVIIDEGPTDKYGRAVIKPAIVIHNYNMKRDHALEHGKDDFSAIDRAYGGIAVEFGDQSEHGSFESFQKHMADTNVQVAWDDQNGRVAVEYTSDGETMRAERPTVVEQEIKGLVSEDWTTTLNGEPYTLARGVNRETPHSTMSWNGRIERGDASLVFDKGMAFLQHEPNTNTYRAMLPRKGASGFRFELPGTLRITADGRAELLDLIVHPDERRLEVHHHFSPDVQDLALAAASALLIDTEGSDWTIELNGESIRPEVVRNRNGQRLALPIAREIRPRDELLKRANQMDDLLGHDGKGNDNNSRPDVALFDILWLGPFPGGPDAVDRDFGPEQQVARDLDLEQTFDGLGDATLKWERFRTWRASLGDRRHPIVGKYSENSKDPSMKPTEDPTTFYGVAAVKSETDRPVQLNFNVSGEDVAVKAWLNGRPLHFPGQNRSTEIHLKRGGNILLFKVVQLEPGTRGARVSISLARPPFGVRDLENVYFVTAEGPIPANPARDDPRVVWTELTNGVVVVNLAQNP